MFGHLVAGSSPLELLTQAITTLRYILVGSRTYKAIIVRLGRKGFARRKKTRERGQKQPYSSAILEDMRGPRTEDPAARVTNGWDAET